MMSDLKRKDPFYDTYVKTSEELTKLRQAHAILISMIQSNHLNIKQGTGQANKKDKKDTIPHSERSGIHSAGYIDKYELQVDQLDQNQASYRGGAGMKSLHSLQISNNQPPPYQ